MALFISAIAAILIGLSVGANPAKLIKDIQVKADSDTKVTANTSTNVDTDSQNKSSNVGMESDEESETNTTANVTDDNDHKFEEKDENHGKAEGHVKVSAFNDSSGKIMMPLVPKVVVDHSGSLDASENVTIGVGNKWAGN